MPASRPASARRAGGRLWTAIRRQALAGAVAVAAASPAGAAEPSFAQAQRHLRAGQYDEAIELGRRATVDGGVALPWRELLTRALVTRGRMDEAVAEARALVERRPTHLRALWAAHETYRRAGREQDAADALARAVVALRAPGARVTGCEDRVAAGEVALRVGEEPKQVLAAYFAAAVGADPGCHGAYLAAARLALAKSDEALAAEWADRGLARFPDDADLRLARAEALFADDRPAALAALEAALRANPQHPGALLLRAEHDLDAEDEAGVRKGLARARAVDPGLPAAWALEAVLAHLAGDAKAETAARARALGRWPRDPEVDTTIGRKLCDRYRFVEGAEALRRALALAPAHLPAKIRLAQALLRLGGPTEAEGFRLAEEVRKADPYDRTAFNLVSLRTHLSALATLGDRRLVLRMDPREARVYGQDVLALLREARRTLDARYGFENPHPVTVEIYPEQADFAVRTFGVPGAGGYLGVCFGNLVTMNSPAGATGAGPSHWPAVLWHEYTHVVTLGLTRNKIPRWLSEGISGYEEQRRDPAWGQALSPRMKQLIDAGELAPLGQLSRAFWAPKSPEHLMFAYYQSALAVAFLVDRAGFDALVAVLRDLGQGVPVNRAIEARIGPLGALEPAFAAYARARAQAAPFDPEAAQRAAAAARARGDAAAERQALEGLVARRPEDAGALGRLLELAEAAGDAAAVERHARVLAGTAPLTAAPWLALGRALEARAAGEGGAAAEAVSAYERALAVGAPDPAVVHLRAARLLRGRDPRAARRHALDALAEAPRFREAHDLLLELAR